MSSFQTLPFTTAPELLTSKPAACLLDCHSNEENLAHGGCIYNRDYGGVESTASFIREQAFSTDGAAIFNTQALRCSFWKVRSYLRSPIRSEIQQPKDSSDRGCFTPRRRPAEPGSNKLPPTSQSSVKNWRGRRVGEKTISTTRNHDCTSVLQYSTYSLRLPWIFRWSIIIPIALFFGAVLSPGNNRFRRSQLKCLSTGKQVEYPS